MKEYLLKMYQFTHDINKIMIDFIIDNNIENEKINRLMSHILNAHMIWLNRIYKIDSSTGPWDNHPLSDWHELNRRAIDATGVLLSGVNDSDLEILITYKNSKGDEFSNKLGDMLCHVINHSTHHRSQVSMIIREEGLKPPATDLIFYLRNK
jgi:uncharacterized damage-inducible protein DinB